MNDIRTEIVDQKAFTGSVYGHNEKGQLKKTAMWFQREYPWQGLGKDIADAKTVDEAIVLSDLNWMVKPMTAYFEETPGVFAPIPATVANVRDRDNRVLGVVSDEYKILQNREAFDVLDYVIDREGGRNFHAAGSLDDGRRTFMVTSMKPVDVLGDRIEPYIIMANSHDTSTGMHIAITPLRQACINALPIAIQNAKRVFSAMHTGNMQAKILEAQQMLARYEEYMTVFPEVAEQMVTRNIYPDEMERLLAELFPAPPEEQATKLILEINERRKDSLMFLYEKQPDIAKFGHTGWAFYNAVADYCAHVEIHRVEQATIVRKADPLSVAKATAADRLTLNRRNTRFLTTIVDKEAGHPLLATAQRLIMAKVKV